MGNTQSAKTSKKKSLEEIVDYIASNYILTQNFKDMENLANMSYCNKLVILTSKIIEKNIMQKSEFYTSGVIKEMINNGVIFNNKTILQSNLTGTETNPHIEVKLFQTTSPRTVERNLIRLDTLMSWFRSY